ncbi:hypothetical protein GL2_33880 [Microbulbifer sp. GL-2]|nr:hypothetical protein GL2_33880 [Microbulbifer sp. GL-2]
MKATPERMPCTKALRGINEGVKLRAKKIAPSSRPETEKAKVFRIHAACGTKPNVSLAQRSSFSAFKTNRNYKL